ncbi:MAG: DUF4870 domain-containing protein [Planctomycetota bacterium]|jgi:uncharacterized Tic20 family protein
MEETNENQDKSEQKGAPVPSQQEQKEPVGEEIDKEARMWSMFCHFGGLAGLLPVMPLVGCLIVPLIIWQVKRDDHSFIDDNGKEALNFQLTVLLIAVLLAITCVGLFLVPFVIIYDVVFALIAGLRANDGKSYQYPIIIRFIS